ncbi:MAG TPA: RsmE family RNA methyltransferase [Verrucomicrobiae bacterium]
MHRFFVPPTELRSSRFPLPEAESRHAAQVLRVRAGDIVQVLDGAGRRYDCAVDTVEKRQVWLRVEKETQVPAPKVAVEVYPAVAKGKAMELIIQKAVELGAAKICPVVCDHSVAHYDDDRAEDKAEKWRLTAIEALKQCGREWLPEVTAPMPFKQCLPPSDNNALNLVAALQEGATPVGERFAAFVKTHDALPSKVRLWVGPEGDFSPAEYLSLKQQGVQAVTLGPHVLRCETALLALLAVCQHEILFRS